MNPTSVADPPDELPRRVHRCIERPDEDNLSGESGKSSLSLGQTRRIVKPGHPDSICSLLDLADDHVNHWLLGAWSMYLKVLWAIHYGQPTRRGQGVPTSYARKAW